MEAKKSVIHSDELLMNDPKPFRSSVEEEWTGSCHRLPANLHGKLHYSSPERARERSRLARHDHESECDYSSDTRLGNRARVSKPIEITDRGILVRHQRRKKHPSGARFAARRDAENR